MRGWFKQATLTIAALSLIVGIAKTSDAQGDNGKGQGQGSEIEVGVGAADAPVVLRPTGRVPNQYIVTFQDDVANPRGLANALAQQNGLTLRGVYSTAIKGFAAQMPQAVAERLALDPNIVAVEQDVYVNAVAQILPNGVDRIDAELNSTFQFSPVDVDVAVIDSGIYPHADYNWSNARFYNCIGGCVPANVFDDNGHGTHVAGTIGAFDNADGVVGVAPGARIWGFKVLDANGSGFISDIIDAIDEVTALGSIEVGNMSLSGQGLVSAFRTAIQNSVAAGVVHVVAAGNAQTDVYGPDGVLNESASFGCLLLGRNCPDDIIPASYPEVMAVSAMADFDGVDGGLNDQTIAFNSCTHSGDDVFACFTNYSQSVDSSNPVTSPGAAVDVAGPGVSVLSTWNDGGYVTISGTSMASPHVAGAAALCIVEDCVLLGGPPASAADVYAVRQALIDEAQAQAAWGPADTKDPDGNPEPLIYVAGAIPLSYDVAVTSVTVPAGALIDTTHTVSVSVTNHGTEEATFDVLLNDDFGANITGGGSIILQAGQSASVDFSWTPTVAGEHTLTGSHNLVGDEKSTNDTSSTAVAVSTPITDAAITSIDAPSPVDVNTAQIVTVGVTNNSTESADIAIELTDSLAFNVDSPQNVTLGSNESVNVNFSWTPTVSGTHVLTAMATLSGDSDDTNDSMQTESNVTEPGAEAYVVGSICYTGEGGRLSDKHMVSTVTITDGTTAVSGVTVSVRIDSNLEPSQSGTGTTDGTGEVAFSWKNADTNASYSTVIESVNSDSNVTTPANTVAWPEDSNACFQ